MSGALIADLTAGRFVDPASGAAANVFTRSVAIAPRLIGEAGERVRALDLGRRFLVIEDEAGHAAAGERIIASLRDALAASILTFPGVAEPSAEAVDTAVVAARHVDALIAIGSGSINDIAKAAATALDLPYIVFGTAPSMNGYVSVNASIRAAGRKSSWPARPPVAVFLDLDVLAAAPRRMILAGLGDSLCRPTAQFDWLLSHLLLRTPYSETPFTLLREAEARLFAGAGGLLRGDRESLRALAETLVLSGFGMTLAGGSYPASQSEHLIAHYVEMTAPLGLPATFHGEEIAVTTLAMAELQQRILDGPMPVLGPDPTSERDLVAGFGPLLGPACWREFAAKRLDAVIVDALNERLAREWDAIRARLAEVALSPETLRAVMLAAGGPTRPKEIGWPADLFRRALTQARFIRNRFTVLDLAAASGALRDFMA